MTDQMLPYVWGAAMSAVMFLVVFLVWMYQDSELARRGEIIRRLAAEKNTDYRFQDPEAWTAGFHSLPPMNGIRFNKTLGGVMRGNVDAREAWLLDFRGYVVSGNVGYRSNYDKYTVAVFRFPPGKVAAFAMATDGMITPYPAAHKIYHHPLIAEVRGKWNLACDGEWLLLYRDVPDGYDSDGCFVPDDLGSYRSFFDEAASIARRLPGAFAA